ncbi:MAG: archease [Ignavibacteriaceae bacterium]
MKSKLSRYRFIDHTADIAVKLEAEDYEELFTIAASAWRKSVVDSEPEGISDSQRISLSSETAEELLVSFVNEINYLLNVKKWLFDEIEKIQIIKSDSSFKLDALLNGKIIDPARAELKTEIKAVTFHQMKIIYDKGLYSTMLVFDI